MSSLGCRPLRFLFALLLATGICGLVLWMTRAEEAPAHMPQRAPRMSAFALKEDQVRGAGAPSADLGDEAPSLPARRLKFVRSGDDEEGEEVVSGLSVEIRVSCNHGKFGQQGPDKEPAEYAQVYVTDSEGAVHLVGVDRRCNLQPKAVNPEVVLIFDDALSQEMEKAGLGRDDETVWVGRSFLQRVTTVNSSELAISGARIESRSPTFTSCETDGSGQCSLRLASRSPLILTIEASGFATRSLEGELPRDLKVVLEPERAVDIAIAAPGSGLLRPMVLRVSGQSFVWKRTVDAPGHFRVRGAPSEALEVDLSEMPQGLEAFARPIAHAEVAAGKGAVEVPLGPLVPRRLDISIEHPRNPNDEDRFCRALVADVRCPGVLRQMVRLMPDSDGRFSRGGLEYAPQGPCQVTKGHCDHRYQPDRRYETMPVSPPGSVSVRLK